MTKQPEALRFADALEADATNGDMGRKPDPKCHKRKAAAELRHLHEVNQALLEALQRIKHHFDTDEYAWRIAEAAIAKAGEQP